MRLSQTCLCLLVVGGCAPAPQPTSQEPPSSSAAPEPSATHGTPSSTAAASLSSVTDDYDAEGAARAKDILNGLLAYHDKISDTPPPPIPPGDLSDMPSMFGWETGELRDVAFVVQPATASERDCVMPDTIGGMRCRYATKSKENAPPPKPDDTLHYFNNELGLAAVLAGGLWTLELPKKRLAEHPDTPVGLTCKVRVVGRAMAGYRLRRHQNYEWTPGPYEVGRFESCALWTPPPPAAAP